MGGALLYITITKMDDIASTCSTTDDEEGLRKVVKVWMDTCPYASWRWLIWRMDEEHPNQGNVHDLADLIRRYAETAGVKNGNFDSLRDIPLLLLPLLLNYIGLLSLSFYGVVYLSGLHTPHIVYRSISYC